VPGLIETGMTKPIFTTPRSVAPRTRSVSSIAEARGQPHELAAMDCFSPAMTRPMSTVRRSRSTRPHRLDAVCGQAV